MSNCGCGTANAQSASSAPTNRVGFSGVIETAGELLIKSCLLPKCGFVGLIMANGSEITFPGYRRQAVQWSNATTSGISRNNNRITFATPQSSSEPKLVDSLGIFEHESGGPRLMRLFLMQSGHVLRLPYTAAFPLDLSPQILALSFANAESDGVVLTATTSCATCS